MMFHDFYFAVSSQYQYNGNMSGWLPAVIAIVVVVAILILLAVIAVITVIVIVYFKQHTKKGHKETK